MHGFVRRGTARAALLGIALAGVGYGAMHVGCKDYIELSVPEDSSIEVLDEASNPPLPTTEAGGEPVRRDAGSIPPADSGGDGSSDARTDG
jgi:hypothetical protein